MPTSRLDSGTLPQELTFHMVEERTLSLDEIDALQYQPSSVQSELNQSLYESIKQIGLQSPLVVSQVPNEKYFVPIAGGNSRLQVLSRLRDETGDISFANVQCVVSEWPGLARAQLAHVITNQVHIRYSFASRALAIVHIVDSQRAISESKPMSQRDCVQFLTSNGYPISQSTFGYMEYLVHRVHPFVSMELLDTVSMLDIRELREIEDDARENLRDQIELKTEFRDFFAHALEEAAAKSTEIGELIEKLRFKVSFLEEERSLKPLYEPDDRASTVLIESSSLTGILNQSGESGKARELTKSPEATKSLTDSRDDPNQSKHISAVSTHAQVDTARIDFAQHTINELREAAWNLASQLCNSYDMNKCIRNVSNQFGYQVVAKPDDDSSSIQYRLWNYLDVFAGSEDGSLDVNVWTELNDENWRALIELWDAVRMMRKNRRTNASEPPAIHDVLG